MRKMVSIGVGAAAVAMTLGTAAGVASASSGHDVASFTATSTVNKHITKAQARQIAQGKVPNSKAIEIESDDLHDVPVWKVTLSTPHGRVIVDVSKRTGKATIVKHEKHGDDGARGDRRDNDGQRAAGDDRRANDERHGDDRHGNDERHGHDQRRGHDERRGHDRHDRDGHRGHDEHDG